MAHALSGTHCASQEKACHIPATCHILSYTYPFEMILVATKTMQRAGRKFKMHRGAMHALTKHAHGTRTE